jgi:hypothetical protein
MNTNPDQEGISVHRSEEITGQSPTSLLVSVESIKKIASRDQIVVTSSDGGGTGRSDTNDKQNNPG